MKTKMQKAGRSRRKYFDSDKWQSCDATSKAVHVLRRKCQGRSIDEVSIHCNTIDYFQSSGYRYCLLSGYRRGLRPRRTTSERKQPVNNKLTFPSCLVESWTLEKTEISLQLKIKRFHIFLKKCFSSVFMNLPFFPQNLDLFLFLFFT